MSEARVRVSLTEGSLEFEGPEKFVADLVDKFTGVIQTALVGEPAGENDAASPAHENVERPHATASAVASSEVALNDMFAATDAAVQVLGAVPGSTKAARAVNLAKLYLYGLQALKQRETVDFAEVARVCKAHGCFDAKNMAATLKGNRTSFVFGGTGKRQTVRLSAPGREETAALIARIRAAGKGIGERTKGRVPDTLTVASRDKESRSSHTTAPAGSHLASSASPPGSGI